MNRDDAFSFGQILARRGQRFYSLGIAKLVLRGINHSQVLK
jgi:hypothetical protein